jgi:hypothetical protein
MNKTNKKEDTLLSQLMKKIETKKEIVKAEQTPIKKLCEGRPGIVNYLLNKGFAVGQHFDKTHLDQANSDQSEKLHFDVLNVF